MHGFHLKQSDMRENNQQDIFYNILFDILFLQSHDIFDKHEKTAGLTYYIIESGTGMAYVCRTLLKINSGIAKKGNIFSPNSNTVFLLWIACQNKSKYFHKKLKKINYTN